VNFNPIERCPICKRNTVSSKIVETIDGFEIECDICGKFRLTRELQTDGPRSFGTDSPYLSAHTRQASESGNLITLTTTNWKEMADAHRGTRVSRKIEMLLEYVAARTQFLGGGVPMRYELDYPLIDGVSPEECLSAIRYLQQSGVFQERGDTTCILTVPGWERIQGVASIKPQPGRVFVAMWFDDSMEDAYLHGIKAAIEDDCRMTAIRIDKVHHNEKICDRILAEIRIAQCVVADFSGHRSGVYFEAGFAKGLGREVIWTCNEKYFEELKKHFDTRQYNYLRWSTAQDLRQQLADRLRATVLQS
jgi:hypothetical protein